MADQINLGSGDTSRKSSSKTLDNSKCAVCKKLLRRWPRSERRSIKSEQLARDASRLMNRNIQINDFVCRFCHSKISAKISKEKKQQQQQQLSLSKSEMATSEPSSSTTTTTSTMEKENCLPDNVQQQSSEESSSSSDESDDNYNDPSYKAPISVEEKKYEVPYSRPVATHGYCFICSKTENLKIISIQARLDVFRKRKIFIPAANRCCLDHLNNETLLLNENEIDKIPIVMDRCEMTKKEMDIFLFPI